MNNELNRLIAYEQYHDHLRQAQRRAMQNQVQASRPRLLRASAGMMAKLLLVSGERLRHYSEAEAAQIQEVARHA